MKFINLSLFFAMLIATQPLYAELTGPYGGQIVRKNGANYEVVRNKDQVQVYLSKMVRPRPSELTLVLKKENKIVDRVHLKIDPKRAEPSPYTGIVPAGIFISGGITFDIE